MRVPLDEPAWWYRDDAGGMAACLAPLASIYGWAAATRYARTQPYRSRLPVICAGNFTAGGTGKTPLVLHLCERLRTNGQHPVALTRGYGGRQTGPHRVSDADTADDVGDEALMLARTAPTLIARDRGAGARAVEAMPGLVSVIVMDDGLQNPSLAKDLAIAMVDGSRGLGNGLVIPAGPLRAPLDLQLGLADVIVVNGAGTGAGNQVVERLRHRFNGPVLRSSTVVAGDATWLQGQRIVAWAGIASPQRFIATLETQGAEVVERVFSAITNVSGKPMPSVFSLSRTGSRHASSARKRTWHASKARSGNLPRLPLPRGSCRSGSALPNPTPSASRP